MRLKTTAILALTLLLFSSLALAIDKSPQPGTHSKLYQPPSVRHGSAFTSRAMFEGFEGAFPPVGWTQGIFNTTYTWEQQSYGPIEGSYEAYIHWDTYNPSNETLEFSQYVDVAGGEYVLSFWMAGSIGQSWDLFVAETVEIDGTTVFDFDSSVTVGYMVYDKYFIDLSAYDGTTVTITFRYEGQDGDAHYIDAVMVDDGTGYVVPPVDFCSLVEDAEGTGMFYGDTCDGQNLIFDLDCDYYTEYGLEDYYGVLVAAGGSFTATVTNTADGALWVLAECSAAGGLFTCLAYIDDTFTGDPEVISYTNTTGSEQIVYLVIDSWGGGSCGTYEMDFQGLDAIANEVMSLGDVKTLYR
ncbi:choice-of-anchor J domain-containing protein [bacterium]|nr:choice-of-anchor J domain-containing protein [bacterium]MBU1071631.1 choice-of-anchor J domain-containing protein [bacterium]MBU1675069.1 choice-of-anchor J domain-containing protein [bacterium]